MIFYFDISLKAFHCVEKGFYDSIDDLLAEKAKLLLQTEVDINYCMCMGYTI